MSAALPPMNELHFVKTRNEPKISFKPDVAFSPETTPAISEPGGPKRSGKHSRMYQACIACRRRKVKCDMGPVDDPHDPPCMRCKRESKKCFFSEHRRKRKGDQLENGNDDDAEADVYAIDGNRRVKMRVRTEHLGYAPSYRRPSLGGSDLPPITPGGGFGQPRPLRRPVSGRRPRQDFDSEEEQKANVAAAARLQHGQLYNNHDALNLLAETAVASGSTEQVPLSSFLPAFVESNGFGTAPSETPRRSAFMIGESPVKVEMPGSSAPQYYYERPQDIKDGIAIWNKVRYVRANFFSAVEGMRYVDFFYKKLYPLTPVVLPNFRDVSTHNELLREEPMLALTILTIASRHIPPSNGSQMQGFEIHKRLWDQLREMICRMFLGQDRFQSDTSGFQPLSAYHNRVLGLRAFGSIESLLLLTEWHPVMLHFPSHDAGNGVIIEDDAQDPLMTGFGEHTSPNGQPSADYWRGPSCRSDAMTWSLLSTATSLAYELGLFNAGPRPETPSTERAEKIRRMLYVFSVQISGRLSIPTMVSDKQWERVINENNELFHFTGPDPEAYDGASEDSPDEDTTQHFWLRLARLFNIGNDVLWASESRARELVAKGSYAEKLNSLTNQHEQWKHDLDNCKAIRENRRSVLEIEYYYMRVHGNSIALQAVVDRCLGATSQDLTQPFPQEILEGCMGDDRKYFDMILDDGRALLRCIVDGLAKNHGLAHITNRTFWRIANVVIILLKTLSLGIYCEKGTEALDLLEDAAQAMSTHVVDELHIAINFAELLPSMTGRLRANLSRGKSSRSASTTSNQGTSEHPNRSSPSTLQPMPSIGPLVSFPSAINSPTATKLPALPGFGSNRPNVSRPSPLSQSQPFNFGGAQQYNPPDYSAPPSNWMNPDGTLKDWTPLRDYGMTVPSPASNNFNATTQNGHLMPPLSALQHTFSASPQAPEPVRYGPITSSQGLDATLATSLDSPSYHAWQSMDRAPQYINPSWTHLPNTNNAAGASSTNAGQNTAQ